jgi:carbamoyl-phosphate synthase small subunit
MTKTLGEAAILALADGSVFRGLSFGAHASSAAPAVGEVVFNTSLYGYQEILTDPSYAGQMMTFTYPHIGNVGCNSQDNESGRVWVQGLIVRSISSRVSNFRAEESLHEFLQRAGVMGIAKIDTRELVKHLRDHGAQMGAMAVGDDTIIPKLIEAAKAAGSMLGKTYVSEVSTKEPYGWDELPWDLSLGDFPRLQQNQMWNRPHVVAIDCGIKRNILRKLLAIGFRVTVVPAFSTSEEILALHPDALFLSNGPGDPAALTTIVDTVKSFLGRLPIFGICLGHQILGQALGGKTYKLKFGHRGGNHPVIDYTTNEIEISVQNHGFAVDPKTLPASVKITHSNLNDQTVEGLSEPSLKVFSVQYHPEATPGPFDSSYLFQRFYELVVG